jgi:hypothetical protein
VSANLLKGLWQPRASKIGRRVSGSVTAAVKRTGVYRLSPMMTWAAYLPAEQRDLVAQHEKLDVLGALAAGQLGQHLQQLTQQQVDQRHAHDRQRDSLVPCQYSVRGVTWGFVDRVRLLVGTG